MSKIREYLKNKPHVVLSVPAVLCFITFITNFIRAMSDGNIDSSELHTLLASADGFESVVLFALMMAIKDKKK